MTSLNLFYIPHPLSCYTLKTWHACTGKVSLYLLIEVTRVQNLAKKGKNKCIDVFY
jgi:hypothetical protein